MEASQAIARAGVSRRLFASIDFQAIAVWILGFLLVVYLGLEGGGYDPVLRNQLGIAVWWGVLLGVSLGALPLNRLRYGSWLAVGLLGAYVVWVALSAAWSTTPEGAFADLGRVGTYLGVFVLGLSIRSSKGARRMVSALGAAIVVVAIAALLSRLHPSWFPGAAETVGLLKDNRGRLAYPLGYWNGLAALVAIGLPLVLYSASSARHLITQALAAAALPALMLTLYFTLSRGGTLAAIVGVVAFLALAHDRIPKAATLVIAGVGAAILIVAAGQRDALDAGLTGPAAREQGDELLTMALVVCAGVGLLQTGFGLALRNLRRPNWTMPSVRASRGFLLAMAVGALLVVGILGASGKATSAWHEFKASDGAGTGSARLESFSSNGRWPYWSAAVDEFESAPLVGKGSGSYEAWWAEHRGPRHGFVKDAHSLYLETLGELGLVGFILIAGFLGTVLVIGFLRYADAARSRRTALGAALASCCGFAVAGAVDWVWELAVVPIAFLLLASVLVSAGERRRRKPPPVAARISVAAVSVAAIVAIAMPLSVATSLEQSQANARAGDLSGALSEARNAQKVEPFAAGPFLQEALVLERLHSLEAAESAARSAVHKEPHDWRAWVVLSRLQAERGRSAASLGSYREARSLNPHSVLFLR